MIAFTLSLLLSQIEVMAQQTLVYKYDGQGSVYELDSENVLNLLVTLDASVPEFSDIALGPSGAVYGIEGAGIISEIDLLNGTTEVVVALSSVVHVALTCDSESKLYALDAFENLWSYDLQTQTEELIMFLGETTPGDLAFYNGHIVFPAGDGTIKALDPQTLELVTIYCIPPEILDMTDVWGITNTFDSCGEEKLLLATHINTLWRVDVENNSHVFLDVTYDVDAGGNIRGCTSGGDLLASECDGQVTPIECGTVGLVHLMTDADDIIVYPNPVEESINIEVSESAVVSKVDVIDPNGRTVQSVHQPPSQFSIEELDPGYFIVRIHLEDGRQYIQRMIKVR